MGGQAWQLTFEILTMSQIRHIHVCMMSLGKNEMHLSSLEELERTGHLRVSSLAVFLITEVFIQFLSWKVIVKQFKL